MESCIMNKSSDPQRNWCRTDWGEQPEYQKFLEILRNVQKEQHVIPGLNGLPIFENKPKKSFWSFIKGLFRR